MSVKITFDTAENCAAFATKTGLVVEPDATSVDVPWGKLKVAKKSTGAIGFEHTALLRSSENGEAAPVVEFIMKGDISNEAVAALINVKADLGNGFYHVETSNGLALYDLVEGLDPVDASHVVFHSVSSINGVYPSQAGIDPLGADGQWARIRVASSYRPVLTSFEYYDGLITKSTPEVYIIDSGVHWDHPEFADVDHVDFWKAPMFADYDDKIGHGTAMASAICGKNVGISRTAKVLNCKIAEPTGYCSFLDVGNLIDLIIEETKKDPNVTRIVNASWAVDENTWLESKFLQLLEAGVTVVCAAGNSGIDVDTLTPSGMPEVITVGAIDRYDIPAGFNNIAPSDSGLTTNFGQRLDIFAPGDNVALATVDGGYMLSSGTSAASAFVAGVAAQISSLFAQAVPNPVLFNYLIDMSTTDAILFDDDKFSDNQNRIIHLVGTKDVQAAQLDLYLGAMTPDKTSINLNANTIIDISEYTALLPDEAFTWGLVYENAEVEAAYGSFIVLDPVTGNLDISTPTVPLPEGENIFMVRFKITATSPSVTIESPWLLFFQVDPNADSTTTENDITRALAETNSTSIFMAQSTLK